MPLSQSSLAGSFVNFSSASLAEHWVCFSSAAVSVEESLPETEVYEKRVAKSAAVTALWCVLELNVKVPMKVRHVSEHNVWFFERGRERAPTISLSEPAGSLKCPQRSVEGRRGSRLLRRCQSQFQTSRR